MHTSMADRKTRTSSVRKRKGRKPMTSRSPISERAIWLTRGIETAMILYSLLGTIEANAADQVKKVQQRSPSAISKLGIKTSNGDLNRKLAAASKTVSTPQKPDDLNLSLLKERAWIAPQSIFFSESVAPSVKSSPYYANTTFTLFRIPFKF